MALTFLIAQDSPGESSPGIRPCPRLTWFGKQKLKSFFKVLLLLLVLLLVVYFEWFCYFLLRFQWPNLSCGQVKDVHRILFVADPQILGEKTESFIARSDCDLYLKSTFYHALNYVQPDLIIFLGDQMDEGSTAPPQEYERYYKRFRDIFQLDYIPKNKTIFLPGDNDIGGENEEITEYKVRRFEKYFPSKSDTILYKNLKIFKVNQMLNTFPHEDIRNDTSIRILVSHIPLLGIMSGLGEQAISELKPHLIFSAHDHKSVHMVTKKDSPVRDLVELLEVEKSGWRFGHLNYGRVNEIVVPTSSYRMGSQHPGYGAALLSVDGDVLCYFTLMCPKRLYHLWALLISVSVYLAFVVISLLCSPRREVPLFYKLPV